MLRKSRSRAVQALLGSALLLALPLATGCQTANFSGNVPGFGWVQGWWGGDASKADPNKPPAGYLPSSKADPNGSSYAGATGRGRAARDGYGSEGAGGYESKRNTGASYAAGDRGNPNNWGSANRQASGASSANDNDTEYAGGSAKGYGAGSSVRGDRSAGGGNDPYGSSSPSNEDDSYASSVRGSAYSADSRNGSYGRANAGGYNTKMTSGSQRATREPAEEEMEDVGETDEPSNASGSRYSTGGYGGSATAPRGGRSAKTMEPEAEDAMTADEDVEANYPQTTGYGSSYKVPQRQSSSAPAGERRYPSSKSSGASKSINDDYGMTEKTESETDGEEAEVQQVAATETGRYGLSPKAASMLDRSSAGEFRPGTTGRPGYSKRGSVAQAGYSDEEAAESAATRTSRFAE
jgi:hypothetical protein